MTTSNFSKAFDSITRLKIAVLLQGNTWVDYSTIKNDLDLTDGNLASHLAHLHRNKLIKKKRKFAHNRPQTNYALTAKGIKEFQSHAEALIELLQ